MSRNFIQPGKVITLTAPSGGVVGGNAYLIGTLLVVAMGTVAQGLPFEGATEGVFELPKTTGATWSEGDSLYWDNSGFKFTKVATGKVLAGCACRLGGELSAAATGIVRLTGANRPAEA